VSASFALCLQLAGQLRSLHKLPVGYVALDWHQMDKELGSEALVEAFWTQLSALLPPQVGFRLPPSSLADLDPVALLLLLCATWHGAVTLSPRQQDLHCVK
jgi:hypothetical protein